MRKLVAAVVGVVVLAAAGFATASIVKNPGKGHRGISTSGSTTGTVPTQTGTTGGRKVTICHKTGSKTNPGVTITVSENAWPAHMAHGDQLGACPPRAGHDQEDADTAKKDKKKHKAKHHAKPEHAQNGKAEHAAKPKHHASPSHAPKHGKPHGSKPTTQPVHGKSGDHGNGGHGKGK